MYGQPSEIANEMKEIEKALSPCLNCPEGQSFAIPSSYPPELVQMALICHYPGFVGKFHGDVTEIYRFAIKVDQRSIVAIRKCCADYLSGGKSYDKSATKEMVDNRVISYSHISRRLSATASFRNSIDGPTKELVAAIHKLIEQGYLIELSKNTCEVDYKTHAKLYMIKED
jgi:hypothetical protein